MTPFADLFVVALAYGLLGEAKVVNSKSSQSGEVTDENKLDGLGGAVVVDGSGQVLNNAAAADAGQVSGIQNVQSAYSSHSAVEEIQGDEASARAAQANTIHNVQARIADVQREQAAAIKNIHTKKATPDSALEEAQAAHAARVQAEAMANACAVEANAKAVAEDAATRYPQETALLLGDDYGLGIGMELIGVGVPADVGPVVGSLGGGWSVGGGWAFGGGWSIGTESANSTTKPGSVTSELIIISQPPCL